MDRDSSAEAGAIVRAIAGLGTSLGIATTAEGVETLPLALQDLLEKSDNLYRRIARLDDVLFGQGVPSQGARGQQDALAQAFGD